MALHFKQLVQSLILAFAVGLFFFENMAQAQLRQPDQLHRLAIKTGKVNAGLLQSKANLDAEIVLTQVHDGMFLDGDEDDAEQVAWEPADLRCGLRYGVKPGNRDLENNYPQTATVTGTGSFMLKPFQEGMRTGVYYCILVAEDDPGKTSVEFKVIVEASSAARAISPLGNIRLQQGAPLFQWDAVDGVPYYLVLLSEGQVSLERNEDGEIEGIAGLNLIWLGITSESFLKYGDPDPSGNFANAHIPPLLQDVQYNWIVLNGYSPNPDFVSSKVTPVAPSAFTVTRPTLASAPTLTQPANETTLSGQEIVFSWSEVPEATRYRLFIFETAEFSGNTIKYPLWGQITSDNQVRIDAANLLIKADYAWRVIAENATGISNSERRTFQYDGPAGWVRFSASSQEGPLARASIDIRNEAEAPVLLPAQTDTIGVSRIGLPVGNYTFVASRPGFQTTRPESFSIAAGQTTQVAVELIRSKNTISGRIVDEQGAGIFNAVVDLLSGDQNESVTSDENGYFTFWPAAGGYTLRARKREFVTSPATAVSLRPEETIDVGEIVLRPATNTVSGQVAFSEDGRPLQGALLRASQDDIVYETTTNTQGGFRFKLGPGTWRITIDSQGFVASPPAHTLSLGEAQQVSASFQLSSGGLAYGTVSFENRGIQGAEIRAHDAGGQLVQSVFTNTQGAYSIGLPQGAFTLVASRENFLAQEQSVSVIPGETLVQNFSLQEAGFIEGKVINLETAAPAEGARVFVVEDTTINTLTDAAGEYRLSVPPDTPLQIDAALTGFSSNGPLSVSASSGEVVDGRDFLLTALSGIIRGRVTDGFAPLPQATVIIESLALQATTDDEGNFEFEIEPGPYQIRASKECHFDAVVSVTLQAGTVLEPMIELQPLQSEITGQVLDTSGQPIAAATITAEDDTAFTATTDNDGTYSLCLNSGIFRVTASKPGYFPADTALVVNSGDLHADIDFALRESFATVSGTVQDTLGSALRQAIVRLVQPSQTLFDTTGADGRYLFPRVIAGNAEIRAFKQGLFGLRETTFLSELQQASLDLTLYPADGFIEGVVRDSRDSSGISDVTVQALFSRNRQDIFTATSEEDGAYTITGLPVVAGAHFRVLAFKDQYLSPATPWPAVPAKSSGIDFLLTNLNGMIAGTVLDNDTSEPVSGARVEATITGGGSRSVAVTDEAGQFVLEKLAPANTYTLKTSREGFFPQTRTGLAPGDTSLVIRLLRKYGFVQGRVTNLATGAAMRNVPVVASPGLEGREATVRTDSRGNYVLRLVPDFYNISTALSHHRSDPAQQQVEVAELDTVAGIDFRLERQDVQAITIQRADLTNKPAISNLEVHCYTVDARDPENRPVTIGRPRWSLDVSAKAATIDNDGCVTLDPAYFGDLTIKAEDITSGLSGELQVTVFAPVDSTSNVLLFDDRGLEMQVPTSAVLSRKDLQVTRQPLAPAKKGRAEYFTTDFSYTLKPTGLTFNEPVTLMLPVPPNTEGQERHVAKWDDVKNEWLLLAPLGQTGNNTVSARILDTGEYVSLALSKPLTIDNLRLLPNPFSPFQEINGVPGLRVEFDIASDAAPTPLLTVKVYNLEGNLVRLLHDQTPFQRGRAIITWDGRTDSGALARNGRYLVRVIVEDPVDKRDEMKSVVLIK